MRAILYALLAVDCAQIVIAVAAFVRGRRSSQAGAPSHARYSFAHGLLLLGGAVLLALPVVLGLADVISATVAVGVALGLEVVAFGVSRRTVSRLEAAHQARRPGAVH
jgi:hypothetical protein